MMSRIRVCCSVLSVSMLLVVSAVAQATVFTDAAAFDAANPGLPVVDFEGVAGGGLVPVPDYSAQGVTFSDPGGNTNALIVSDGSSFAGASDFLMMSDGGKPLVMHFNPDVAAVGFNLSLYSNGGEATVDAFDGASLLESITLTTAAPADFSTFVGFSGIGNVTEVRITPSTPPPGNFYLVLADNVAFGVPEPTSLSLLAIGVVLGIRRRGKFVPVALRGHTS